MARIINNKLLFIHVAKTGGTFVREVFNLYGIPNWETGDFAVEDHYSIEQVMDAHPDLELKNLRSFGFVRHPVSWYRSRWAYAKMTKFREKCAFIPEARQHWMYKVWDEDLNKFVENILIHERGIATRYFHGMLGGVLLDDEPQVDRIYRYEDMEKSVRYLLNLLGAEFKPNDPRIGRPKNSNHIEHHISPDLVREIEHAESALIRGFY